MIKSNRFSRIIVAVLLTGALIANSYQIGVVATDSEIKQANLFNIRLMKGTPITWPDGTFRGCLVGGSGCWILTTALGDVTMSGEGLHIQ